MALPLHGVRVLDVTNVLAGPFCSYQLVLLGAEVIKIEHPENGDLARRLGAGVQGNADLMGASFVSVNAGKQSVTINLKDPEGKEIFKKLTAISHVVLENFRPGVMARLGLDYAALSEVNPRLVYCSISGFGQDGPLAMRPAYDQVIQGISGVMHVTGDAQTAPLRVGYPICDTLGGITGAMAICAALVDSLTTGQGRRIDVSMLESTLASMGWVVSNYLNAGVEPIPMGNENFTAAPSGTFRTGDGLLNIAANEDAQYEKLCDLIGRTDLKTDPRFEDRETRRGNRLAINKEIAPELMKRSAAEWEKTLVEAGVPAGRVLSVPEILGHPHLSGRQFISEFEGAAGKQIVTRGGFVFSDSQAAPAGPAPSLAEHTGKWLEKLGYDPETIRNLREKRVI
ncbi:MAG TPA: CoA transferase [Verrucomicrobiae bacterium]|jgi:crotonobetainyl-CoA:carnitine CoA-transferase CaiB-like acyl-CoA transferase|nr:CoA transferase [Verrucomicrobiae bacterium]